MSINLETALARHKKMKRYRVRSVLQSWSGIQRTYQGKNCISFSSNDYLGLAQHPDVITAFKQAADEYGIGSGSSHFLGAYSSVHRALEEALEDFTGYPRALVFSTGYMANLSVLTALLTRHDSVFGDRLNHASLIDAARFCAATFKRYQHNHVASLVNQLCRTQTSSARHTYIVTDGVFSMDGDLAALPDLVEIARKYSATLFVDDAHGVGVLGKKGRGISEYFNVKPDILSGSFGKAFGCFGGFVVGSESIIENLLQFSRPYMYTTALPPAIARAAYASLLLLQAEDWRRARLHSVISYFKRVAAQLALPILPSETAIQPLLVGGV